MATREQQEQEQQPGRKAAAASEQRRRTSLRGVEETIFDLMFAESAPDRWSKWLRAPLEHAARAGNLDLVRRLEGAGARGGPLHVALRCGQEALARELLRMGACPKEKDDTGDTPLHLAAALGNKNIVSELIRRGSPVDALDSKGRTPIHLSAKRGSLGAVEALLAAGADLALRDGDGDKSALDLAAGGGHVRVTRALIQHGVGVNARDSNGCTALHAAADNNRAGTIDALAKAGANVDVQGGDEDLQWTPLHMACERGFLEAVMSLLKHGADVHRLGMTCRGGWGGRCSALFLAASGNSIAIVNALLAAGARLNLRLRYSGNSALHMAALSGNVEIIKALIKHGLSVDTTNYEGRTALFMAAERPNNVAAIDALVAAGARVAGLVDNDGMTPLHLAATGDCSKCIISLLKHGACIDARDRVGQTPLHAASREGCSESISALLGYGADVNKRNKKDRTALSLAAKQDHCEAMKFLLDAGADIDTPAHYVDGSPAIVLAAAKDCADAIKLLTRHGADVNAANDDGTTALHRAAERNSVESIDALIAASANTESTDKHARTPLVVAFRSAFFRWKEEGEDSAGADEFAAMIALLKHGASTNARDHEEHELPPRMRKATSKTSLHYCAALGCPLSVVQALLDAGADIEALDERECTPLHNAVEEDNPAVFRALLLHGVDVDAQDLDGRTVLHKVAGAESNVVADVDKLISAGAATTIDDKLGRTPLHVAALSRRPNVMRALLRSGADIASVDHGCFSALHLAVKGDAYGLEAADAAKAVDLLLRWGADENATDSSPSRRTPAQLWTEEARTFEVPVADRAPVRQLLQNAQRDRAWRRRGWLMLCRVFRDRVRMRADDSTARIEVIRSVRARRGAGSGGGVDPLPAQREASTKSASRHRKRHFGGLNELVARVVGLHEEGVFRNVMEFV